MSTVCTMLLYTGITAVFLQLTTAGNNAKDSANLHRSDEDALCECYSISLDAISGMISSEDDEEEVVCYTYSIQYDMQRPECQSPSVSIVFGACDAKHPTTQTLQDSLIAIYHQQEQLTSSSYAITSTEHDSLSGLEITDLEPSTTADQLTICMQHVNDRGITSNNVEFIVNNSEVLSCHNHRNHQGLPCPLDVSSPQQSQIRQDMQMVAASPPKPADIDSTASSSEHSKPAPDSNSDPMPIEYDTKYKTVSAANANEKVAEVLNRGSRSNNELADTFELKSNAQDESETHKQAISISGRRWIKFAFVTIMIFIGLNALCCTLLALRQSGALDKYFDQVPDEEDECLSDEPSADEIDGDIDDEDNIDDEENEVSLSRQARPIFDEITFSDLVAMRQKELVEENDCDEFDDDDDDEEENDAERRTLKIYISQLEATQRGVGTPFKE